MDKQIAVKCENLDFSYSKDQKVLHNINLDIAASEKIALIGPNGAGKSTFILTLNGLLKSHGNIFIHGTKLTEKTIYEIRKKVGIVFQDPNDQLFCPTVFEDIAFGPLHFDMEQSKISSIVTSGLEQVGLSGFEEKSSHHLSLGEKKRVSLATVLVLQPEILVLDEPSANLDPKHRRDIINMLKEWKYTTIIATHDLDLALEVCSRCIILNNGRIVANGNTKEILSNERLLQENDLFSHEYR